MLPDRISNPGPLAYESGALVLEGKTHVIAEFYNTDLDIRGHSREGKKRPFHSQINVVTQK